MQRKILIVDDQAPIRRVLKMGLSSAGYQVDTASNGAECLLRLCEQQPDFLVTDIDMPRMTGKELCLAIENQFPNRTFPIVVLTSRTEREHRDWTGTIDNLDFMEKPVSVKKLVGFIDSSLANQDITAVS